MAEKHLGEYILGNVRKRDVDWWKEMAVPVVQEAIEEVLVQRSHAHLTGFKELQKQVLVPLLVKMLIGVERKEVTDIFQVVEEELEALVWSVPVNRPWWEHHSIKGYSPGSIGAMLESDRSSPRTM